MSAFVVLYYTVRCDDHHMADTPRNHHLVRRRRIPYSLGLVTNMVVFTHPSLRFRARRQFVAATLFAVLVAATFLLTAAFPASADTAPPTFGGRFDRLQPPQRELVKKWITEYARITGKPLDAETAYDSLSLSTRTTFEAVTHALMTTSLTADDGTVLGNALDIVRLVETVHGQVPNTRGDHQFRVYVLLKPEALDLLYRSKEFKRTRDNTIYHVGYPICFRQQGGVPSIQISVTRTGRRADIDVDYRSSSGPQALVNGHLTAANSDVRAGNNFQRHVNRWHGFQNWWQNLWGVLNPQTEEPPDQQLVALDVAIPAKPRVRASQPVAEAVHDFYKSWLQDGSPETALSYISVKSYACLAEFQTGETLDSGLAALRILQHMRHGLQSYGKSDSLDEALQGIVLRTPDARIVNQSYGTLFSLEHVSDSTAYLADCRIRQRLKLAEQLPKASHVFGDYYISTARLRKEKGPAAVLTQLWTKEEGYWKIVSFHLEHPFVAPAAPEVADNEGDAPSQATATVAHAAIAKASEQFFNSWLVTRHYAEAAAYFSPRVSSCPDVKDAGSVRQLLGSVGGAVPKRPRLSEMIQAVNFDHSHMQKLTQAHGKAYLLARVSTELADMSECNAGTASRDATSGAPTFDGKSYLTAFTLKDGTGEAAPVSLLWRLERQHWRIVAISIETR